MNSRYDLLQGDCLEVMKTIPDAYVDMVMCDLPYGTTACKWDSVIPFEPLWHEYQRICKENAAIVLTASQPFTSALVMSNIEMFKYQWYWVKNGVTGFANAKKQPLRCVEDILVFYASQPSYFPQGLLPFNRKVNKGKNAGGATVQGDDIGSGRGALRSGNDYIQEFTNYPRQTIHSPSDSDKLHPTQKPVALMEYLIRTYTNEGQTVLDNTMGSGTTGVACMNTGRRFIGIERDAVYFEKAKARIEAAAIPLNDDWT